MTKRFLASEGVAALIIAAAVLVATVSGLFDGLEREAYDLNLRASATTPDTRVSIVSVDERSIRELGAWPWPRSLQAELISRISAAKPAVIASTFLYDVPDRNLGLEHLRRLRQQVSDSSLASAADETALLDVLLGEAHFALGHNPPPAFHELRRFFNGSSLKRALPRDVAELNRQLAGLERELDTDRALASSLGTAGNVLLPADFTLTRDTPDAAPALPDSIRAQALENIRGQFDASVAAQLPLNVRDARVPFALLGQEAAGVAHFNARAYRDGGLDTEPLVVRNGKTLYPSLALLVAARGLGLEAGDISVRPGDRKSVV